MSKNLKKTFGDNIKVFLRNLKNIGDHFKNLKNIGDNIKMFLRNLKNIGEHVKKSKKNLR